MTAPEIERLTSENEALRAQVSVMREALAFYSDPYRMIDAGTAPMGHENVPDFYSELCFGDVADEALSSLSTGDALEAAPTPDNRVEELEEALKTALNLFHKHSVKLDHLSSPATFAELIDAREGECVLYGLRAILSKTEAN